MSTLKLSTKFRESKVLNGRLNMVSPYDIGMIFRKVFLESHTSILDGFVMFKCMCSIDYATYAA